MDRFALFIDAGHLLAEGGSLCCGTKKRSAIQCDFGSLIEELSQLCKKQCGLPMLRAYWYDAARDAIPTSEQLLIARLPWTKLRLGRLSGGKQKGVDSLIVRDLMTVARERAVATAFLLGGDDDLREGMVAAQEMGVSVTVLGIPTTLAGTANQAETLIREADQHTMLPAAFLARFLTARDAPALPPPAAQPLAVPPPATLLMDSETIATAATSFAVTWISEQTSDEIVRLIARAPVIPKTLDVLLLRSIEGAIGSSLRDRDDLKKDARAAFWKTIKALAPASLGSPPVSPRAAV
jgi:uncharacterized LabA/DUF88 family protein